MRMLAVLLACLAGPAAAVTCADVTFEGDSYTTCTVDVTASDLRLYLRDPAGEIIGSFAGLAALAPDKTLSFAMNAGMYHEDRSPVGLFQKDGDVISALVTRAGPGNFGLLPNGVLCLTDSSATIIETGTYAAEQPACRDANQSGPMLVIDGALHPRFLRQSSSVNIRNGVGTSDDGRTAIFAISNVPVNFHSFGRFFRDALQTPNALYLDGSVSRLHAPGLNRSDFGFQLGPMIGVFE